MKLKVGQKLFSIREEKKLTQLEISEMLGISQSVYARLERNETQADMDQLMKFAEVLDVPVHEFLPDSLNFSNNKIQEGGLIFGNYTKTVNNEEHIKGLEKEIEFLKKEMSLKDQLNESLKAQIELLGRK